MNWLNTLPYRVEVGKLSKLRERLARDAVTKRLIPYFKGRDLNELTPPVIRRFHAHQRKVALEAVQAGPQRVSEIRDGRRVTWSTMPRLYTPSAEEMMCSWIRQIFQQAVDDDLLQQREVPHLPTIKHERKKRGTLTREQWAKLIAYLIPWRDKVNDVRVKFHRAMFIEYVHFMSSSGLRVGEARQLKWGHISTFESEDGQKQISLRTAAGKTGKRVCVPQPRVIATIERIRAMHPDPSPKNHVFVDWRGEPNGSFHSTWSRVVKQLEIDEDIEGQPITLYSLRHFYVTERLRSGVDIYMLAKNCGTSVRQIERTYSHVIPETIALHLTKVQKLTEDQEIRQQYLDFM
ncbi:hypothetical protein N825_17885 [Skermanella stibiiresistens SB22]|uniref:Tyr recombinase domain-containing protein n=2 Tax=Skermanella TaxID=204447 RepID=W9GYF8_9PROT|nr:hypothetical protein N825_17885 [Skermanella stibiiresistens SB22]